MTATRLPQSRLSWEDYYCPPNVYDEAFEGPSTPRPAWSVLLEELGGLGAAELTRLTTQAERTLRENGVTFNVFAGAGGQRPWSLDLCPLLISQQEYQQLAERLEQRARLLEQIIQDLYGPQELIRSGGLPAEVLYAHPMFQRAFCGLHRPGSESLTFFAAELARSRSGEWCVMADRTDAPVGLGFVLENRIVTARMLSPIVHDVGVMRLAPYFISLMRALRRLAPPGREHPGIVLLSAGPRFRYYFEDVYLARYLGLTLVEGGDLAVRDDRVFLKTLAGLQPVEVILSRHAEQGVDPLEQGGTAAFGAPGLLQAIRCGHVRLANVPGCGLLEAPVFMAFLPALCRRLLGEELLLPSIETWWCGDELARRRVFEQFEALVIKPAFLASGGDEVIVSELSGLQREELRGRIERQPHRYVAQPKIERSAAPSWKNGRLAPGHVAIRCFGLARGDGGFDLLPGGLVRAAPTPEPMELSVLAGDSSKDLWVLAEGPVPMVSLLDSEDEPVVLRRTGALFPSRVADNLYWLGQALERADFLSRLLRAAVDRMTAESDADVPELPVLVRALADQGQLDPGFAVQEFTESLPQLEELLPRLVFETIEPKGLGAALAELKRLNASVRDWLSVDTWKTIQQTIDTFFAAGPAASDLAAVLSSLERLIVDLASVCGLVTDGMIRGPAWRFLDLGRRVERARDVIGLLLSFIGAGRLAEKPLLKALLELIDCRMTYRSRYLDNVQQNGVLDLAVTDETNPHSLAFQALALAEHMDRLPETTTHPLRSEELRAVMAIVHSVRMVTNEQLIQSPPEAMEAILTTTDNRLKQLSDMLLRKYLVHSGPARQITDKR